MVDLYNQLVGGNALRIFRRFLPVWWNKSKYKKVGILPIRIVKSNVSSAGPSSERNIFLSDEGPTLESLDFTIHIGSKPTFFISICIWTLPTQRTTFISLDGTNQQWVDCRLVARVASLSLQNSQIIKVPIAYVGNLLIRNLWIVLRKNVYFHGLSRSQRCCI